mmetsp:Transcript_99466/g.197103  ORF Transcript_99466/g.197103 Transcript_99466/m.197103 type:complete len:242 (+) Transcript_99466:92-817(+)
MTVPRSCCSNQAVVRLAFVALLAWATRVFRVTQCDLPGGARANFLSRPALLPQTSSIQRQSISQRRLLPRAALETPFSEVQSARSVPVSDSSRSLGDDDSPQQVSDEDLSRLRLMRNSIMTALISEQDLRTLLEQAVQNRQLVVVDYYAPWCRVCRRLLKQLEGISRDAAYSNVLFASVDYTQARDLCKGHDVQKLPTLEIYQGDQLTQRWSGSSKQRLLERIDKEMQEMHEATPHTAAIA